MKTAPTAFWIALALMTGCVPLAVGVLTYQSIEQSVGCAATLTDPEPGWPKLEVVWRIVSAETVRQNCGAVWRACTYAHFELGQAWIYITAEDYEDKACREHEQGHAEGRSHKYGNAEWARQVMDYYEHRMTK